MKSIANSLLVIILMLNSAFLFANNDTFNTRNIPSGVASWPIYPAVPIADNWIDSSFWHEGNVPPTTGSAFNNDVINIGDCFTHPHHYVLRIGNLGNDKNNKIAINVFCNSTLRVQGNIQVNNDFRINVGKGGTSIINGNVDFHNNGVLTINGKVLVRDNIVSHNNTGLLDGSGVLYVGGNVGLNSDSMANSYVTIVRDGKGTDLDLTAPVLSANVIAGPHVALSWQHTPQIIPGFEFFGYQVHRDWARDTLAQAPFDNIISPSGLKNLTFTDNFNNTTLTLADAPEYYVRAVYRSTSNPTQYRFSPISNKVNQFVNLVTLVAPALTGTELPGTTVRVRLNWTFAAPRIDNYTFNRFELFKNGTRIATLLKNVNEWTDTDLHPGAKPIYAIRAVYLNTPGTPGPLGVLSSIEMHTPFSVPVDFTNEPLPIDLLDFSAKAGDAGVSLKWITATEINNNYFTIQRSIDGSNWEIINYVQGAGNSNHIITYTWDDMNPVKGISYYRLKQTDFDGQYEYFDPVAVQFNPSVGAKTEILHVNALGQQLNVTLSNPTGSAHLLVADLQGRLIHREVIEGLEFIQQVSVDIPHSLPGNIVVIRIVGQQNTDERKIGVN